MPDTRAGQFRHRIAILAADLSQLDSYRQPKRSITAVAMRWAKIEPKTGSNLSIEQAGTRAALAEAEITFRYFPGLTVNHTLRYGNIDAPTLTDDVAPNLSDNDAQCLDAAQQPQPARYFRIKSINDPDNLRKFHIVQAVEVAG